MKLNALYKKALKEHFAIGAFNFNNLETLKAIVDACLAASTPALVCVSEGAFSYMGEACIGMFRAEKKRYKDIFLHLDHGKSFEMCKKAIDLGFDSVMIDASSLSFEKNVALTKKVVDYAHARGVWVEAELGVIGGTEDLVSAKKAIFTNAEEAKKFVSLTKADSLAVAIGTSHGAYKFSGESKLNFKRLGEIEKAIPKTPLVLHGASSVPEKYVELLNAYGGDLKGAKGVDEKSLKTACTRHNICKINSDTDLRIAFTAGVREHLLKNPENFDPRKYLSQGKKYVTEAVLEKFRYLSK